MNLLSDSHGTSISKDLTWLNEPKWSFGEDGLTIEPQSPSDFFRSYDGPARDDGALLYRLHKGDFTAIAHTTAELAGFGDAAALMIRVSETQWAKLCLEQSPLGETSAVSVITDPWSDDANNEIIKSPTCFLRVTRSGNVFGMHHSVDGARWRFVRKFAVEMPPEVMIGVAAQAPFATGCKVVFHSFTISPEPVADFRSGE